MTISGFFQFIIGFILGIIFFSAGIAGAAYFYFTKMAVNPAKPTFPAAKPETVPDKQTPSTQASSLFQTQAKTEPEKKDNLPPGAYRARVTWPSGLSLRSSPSKGARRIGGVAYNWEIIILGYSSDRQWQQILVPGSGQEGWVKAGNVVRIE